MDARFIKVWMVMACLLWLLAGTAAAQTQPRPAIAAAAVPEDHYPQQRVEFPGGVVSYANLVYSTINGYQPLKLDIYLPPPAVQGVRPVVMYIHGGGWSGGHSRQNGAFEDFPGVLASIAAKGYVVASVNYRLSGEAKFPAAEQDVKSAVRWLRTNADKYRIDKTRFLVWGGSAGGHLTALTATSCGIAELEPPAPPAGRGEAAAPAKPLESDCVQGAVTWYGIFDFAPLVQPAPQGQGQGQGARAGAPSSGGPGGFLGCQGPCSAEVVRLVSPVSFVDPKDPPMLLIHGVEDKTVAVKQSQDMYELLKKNGVKTELITIPGVGHSFVGPNIEATRDATHKELDATLAFIDATIGDKKK
jgi:acetyl esterase/lipase